MKNDPTPPTADSLWGRYVEVRYDYEEALAEHRPPELNFGRGVSRDSQPGYLLLTETAADDFVPSMHHGFDAANSMRPVVIEPASAANGRFLADHGYVASVGRLLRLQSALMGQQGFPGLLVVPGRAALRALEKIAEASTANAIAMSNLRHHLDDPQFDSILALVKGQGVGRIGVQIRGQTGLIVDWQVEPSHQNCGIGTMLLNRVLELAARSQLVDVFAAVEDLDAAALPLLEKSGFRTVCDFRQWLPPRP